MTAALACGCATRPAGPSDADRAARQAEIARARAAAERKAAVERPGATVCREIHIGIGVPDTIRGTVVASQGTAIDVRIDNPGRHQHVRDGVPISRGQVIRDQASLWSPCL